jgi:hypothetical protein
MTRRRPQTLTKKNAGSVVGLTLGLVLVACNPASASWATSGAGTASGAAYVMPAGSTPAAQATGGDISVTWPAVTLPDGGAVDGYVVHRYNAGSGASATVGGSCTGLVTTPLCTEDNVTAGDWVYTDTPVLANWTGAESPPSPDVSVATVVTATCAACTGAGAAIAVTGRGLRRASY